jgi:predicted phage terminase large subunit-like protein
MNANILKELANSFNLFAVQAIAKTHPDVEFGHERYLEFLCDEIHADLTKPGSKLVINLPPRMMKTWLGIFAVAWHLGRNPSDEVILITKSGRLVKGINYKIRKLLRAKWYRAVFPHTRIESDNASVGAFRTTKGGGVFATSMRGTLAGIGADLIVVDDPNDIADAKYPERLKLANEIFDTSIMTRRNGQGTNIIVIQHRIHENDLSAHVLKTGQFRSVALSLVATKKKTYKLSDGSTWTRTKNTLLRSNLYSRRELEKLRNSPMFYLLQQQDQDKQREAKILDAHFGTSPGFLPYGRRFVSVDAGLKEGPTNSFNVAQVWQEVGSNYHLLDQFRAQCSFVEFERSVIALTKAYKPWAMLIENTANGVVLSARMSGRFSNLSIFEISPGNASKSERLARHRAAIRRRIIFLPADAYWRSAYIDEFKNFPGVYTDQVDATTQLLDSIGLLSRVKPPLAVAFPAGVTATMGPISNSSGTTLYGPRGAALVLGSRLKMRF